MTGVTLEAQLSSPDVQSAIAFFRSQAADGSRLTRWIAAYGEASTRMRFRTETDPDGNKWTPSIRVKLHGGKTLTKSGHLASSQTHEYGPTFARWGSNRIYAAIHQFGGVIKKQAQSRQVRHRTDAKGNLLRRTDERLGKMSGRALIFAKDSHKRAVTRWFEQGEHEIHIPARAFLGISKADEANILAHVEKLIGGLGHVR